MRDDPIITIKGALRLCGHREDYSIRTGGTVLTVIKFAKSENCSKCKLRIAKERKERDEKAISKAREIMESKGFLNCSYMVANEGKTVEVNLYINID